MVILDYTIEKSKDTDDYLIYIDSNTLDELTELSDEIKVELSSFGVSIWKSKQESELNKRDVEHFTSAICNRLAEIFSSCWDFKYGIPAVRLHGDCRKIEPIFNDKCIVVYFVRNNKNEEVQYWEDDIKFIPKIVFVNECSNDTWSSTCCHEFILGWLEAQRKISAEVNNVHNATVLSKLEAWFSPATLEKLIPICNHELCDFCFKVKLDMYIPDFLVVEKFWARRYKIAVELLTSKYNPESIMSIPVEYENKTYSIIFPLVHKLNRGNYKGW